MAVILYRNDVDWRQEEEAARRYFTCVDSRMLLKDNLVIARFSALPFYQEQEKDLKYAGCQMINTYEQHLYIADLGNWYMDLAEFTPRTWNELHEFSWQGNPVRAFGPDAPPAQGLSSGRNCPPPN